MGMGEITIRDIARLSGCGVATVSRVLNGRPGVSQQTRQRVLAVVAEQGFEPNDNAKRLKYPEGTGVAILVKGTRNQLFPPILERAQGLLMQRGCEAAVYYLEEEADEVAFAARLCRERRPQGILFLGGDPAFFQRGFARVEVPSVLLTAGAEGLGFSNLSSLTTDDRGAAEAVVRALAGRGHRAIGLLGGGPGCGWGAALRLEGARRALEALGLPWEQARWEGCRHDMAAGYEAAGRLLSRCPEVTALFALSDVAAVGAIRALADRGMEVPEDLSVVGFDGIPLGNFFLPRLATVRQDAGVLAQRGVALLLERLERPVEGVHQVVPFQLVEGESLAPPRQSEVIGQNGERG